MVQLSSHKFWQQARDLQTPEDILHTKSGSCEFLARVAATSLAHENPRKNMKWTAVHGAPKSNLDKDTDGKRNPGSETHMMRES